MQDFSPLASKLMEEFEVTGEWLFFLADSLTQTIVILITHSLYLLAYGDNWR